MLYTWSVSSNLTSGTNCTVHMRRCPAQGGRKFLLNGLVEPCSKSTAYTPGDGTQARFLPLPFRVRVLVGVPNNGDLMGTGIPG